MWCRNPFGYRPGQVTLWTTVVYLALAIPLIYVHETVPPPPTRRHGLAEGLNVTEAWLDLQTITRTFHPYNSHQNEDVRDFLMGKCKHILERNRVPYTTEDAGGVMWDDEQWSQLKNAPRSPPSPSARNTPVGATVFDDQTSNVTWSAGSLLRSGGGPSSQGHYFEGNNFYVYVHGREDPEGKWWPSKTSSVTDAGPYRGAGGVLVNCHFDSVSTGYGATDDGMACVSMLQMLDYFTRDGHQPKHGIVFLFNNAEEDGLLGARAFGYSPLLQFIHTFVNLEGAGGGGRAVLFRATDLEAAAAYSKSPHPFGSVVAANAFERGVIKSGTDYEVFGAFFGQRGLDIAFYAPRSRYHTMDDDTKHTSVNSIWHMLSAAVASTERLVETTGSVFSGDRSDGNQALVQNGRPTEGVWFDWFGSSWSAFSLGGLFAWSVTLLVATPLALAALTYLLVRQDKCYFLASDITLDAELDDDEPVALGGWRGFFRFPFAFVFAVLLTLASVLLVQKFNPLIVYSSSYAVWAMTLSIFYFCFWLIMRGSSFVRPSALHRGYALLWLFALSWAFQAWAAYAEDQMRIGAFYFAAFFHTSVFLALCISLLEQFALPDKQSFARMHRDDMQMPQETAPAAARLGSPGGNTAAISPTQERESEPSPDETYHEAGDATETTPLRVGDAGYGSGSGFVSGSVSVSVPGGQPTFASTYRRSALLGDASSLLRSHPPFEQEQAWSGRLPTWTWIVQFLLIGPVYLILAGSLALFTMSSMNMTGADGGSVGLPSTAIGVMSILLLLPLTPFMHRITQHIPLFLAAVFVGTLVYNLVAFPFSATHRYKVYFQEVVDVDAGTDVVVIAGLEEFVRPIIAEIPSAAGQAVDCESGTLRSGLTACRYSVPPALHPRVSSNATDAADLISVEASAARDGKTATLKIQARDTRMCRLDLSRPVFGFSVKQGAPRDRRFDSHAADGLRRISLWRRDWQAPWEVTLQLTPETSEHTTDDDDDDDDNNNNNEAAEELKVTVKCAYSDANDVGTIPALHELKRYMPSWSVVSKADVGLVEVRKTYALA